MQNTYKSDLSESALKPFSKSAILKMKKDWHSKLHVSTFPAFQSRRSLFFGVCAWVVLQKKAWRDCDMTIWKIFHRTNTVKI